MFPVGKKAGDSLSILCTVVNRVINGPNIFSDPSKSYPGGSWLEHATVGKAFNWYKTKVLYTSRLQK